VTGDTLIAGAGQTLSNYVPNVYMAQYDTLNVSLAQGIGKYFRVLLQGKNLTNPDIRTVYRSEYIGGDVTKTSSSKGAEFQIALTFEVKF
jgi:hypothetical protein